MVSVVNYGIGNLGSVLNMFKRIGVSANLVNSPSQIEAADKLILPGVGAFDSCMRALNESGMLPAIKNHTLVEKKPLLGICVGYQMLTYKSEEGSLPGLGWLDAETCKFVDVSHKMKIPHMGWNYLKPVQNHQLSANFSQEAENLARAYFVHSYFVKAKNNSDILFETDYILPFASGMAKENIMGVQFHPEKSHKFGMQLFRSFAGLV